MILLVDLSFEWQSMIWHYKSPSFYYSACDSNLSPITYVWQALIFGFTDPSQETILLARLLGAALFGFSVIAWLAQDSVESKAQKVIVSGLFIGKGGSRSPHTAHKNCLTNTSSDFYDSIYID